MILAGAPGFELMCLVLKVVLLTCSTSTYEHSWSIEDWIHPKRRNNLGQELVERLVYTHTNLQLDHLLDLYETGLFPWDIEMTVEDPFSDDEDGVPTEYLTSIPSLNPKMTLTKFLRNLT